MTSAKPQPIIVYGEARAYPVLPLRDIVVFPHMIVPLFAGREKSIRALEEAMRSNAPILLVTQKNAADDNPASDAIYEAGTLASVLELLKLPDGTVKVLVEGLDRARVQKYTDRADYYEAAAVALADTDAKSVEAEALARSVVSDFESHAKLSKTISAEVVGVVQAITDFAKLADTVASHLAVKIADRQGILETLSVSERLEKVLELMQGSEVLFNSAGIFGGGTMTSVSENATHFFGKPVVDWTPDDADAFNYTRDVPRLRLDWDEADGNDEAMVERVEALLARPEAAGLEAIVFGMWGVGDASPTGFIEALIASNSRLPALKALFIGDIVAEENEISWIMNGDLSGLWPAFPGLRELRLRGGNGLELGEMDLPELTSLIIESGGLPREVVADALAAKLPSLTHLELWLGTDNYGATSDEKQFEYLTLSNMPALKTLALRDCDYADKLAAVIAKAPVLERLHRLDLSLGTLGDKGAEALLKSTSVAHLAELDLHHHYIGDDNVSKLKALGPKVNLDEQEDEDEDDRYVAVGE